MLCQGNCRHFHQKMRQDGLMPRGASSTNLAPNFPPEALRDQSVLRDIGGILQFSEVPQERLFLSFPSRESLLRAPSQRAQSHQQTGAEQQNPCCTAQLPPALRGPVFSLYNIEFTFTIEKFSLISVSNKPWPKLLKVGPGPKELQQEDV